MITKLWPAPCQRKKFARIERGMALTHALSFMPGRSDRARLMALELAIPRFRASVWRSWQNLDEPPPGAAALNKALWRVIRVSEDGGLSDLGWRQIGRVTKKVGEMSHNPMDNGLDLALRDSD